MAEQHLWGPRSYYKSAYYLLHNAHFIGEIGYHGCPNVSSVKRFIEPGHWWPYQDNPQWKLHNTYHWRHDGVDRNRIKLMANQVRELFGDIPDNLEDFALASQLVQAEAKKYFIESTRLRKWRTSGVIWWNLIDGWPQFSDAVVDYYFGRKLAYEYIRRVQTPVCVVIGESAGENHLPVVVCNDTRGNAGVAWRVRDAESGETAANGDIDVPAGENWQAARLRTYASDRRLLLIEWTVSGERFGNHYLAGGPIQSFERVRALLPLIAALPRPFDAAAVAR
jgi:beta-mannosidase